VAERSSVGPVAGEDAERVSKLGFESQQRFEVGVISIDRTEGRSGDGRK
jgi:hypothetical protein